MDSIINSNSLLSLNLLLLGCLFFYLLTKVSKHRGVFCLAASLLPLFTLQLGSYLFGNWPTAPIGPRLIVLAVALVPVTIVPVSHVTGRAPAQRPSVLWIAYYGLQSVLLAFVVHQVSSGTVIEWVTAIVEQPIIIIESHWRYYFLNIVGSSVLALLCFDKTLQKASKAEQDRLKFILIAFLSFAVYFSYLAINILLESYVSLSMLQLGAALVLVGSALLAYGFAKHPLWDVNIRVSRHVVFGTLSATAAGAYLIISGALLDLLRLAQPHDISVLLPVAGFGLLIPCLVFYLSPTLQSRARGFITRNFFRHKYDYRDLWRKFSEKSSGSLDIHDLLPRVGEFVSDAMFVRQVAIWLRSPHAHTYRLAYCHDRAGGADIDALLRLDESLVRRQNLGLVRVPGKDEPAATDFPVLDGRALYELGIQRLMLVERNHETLAVIGIGAQRDDGKSSAEDEQFLASVSTQLGHLILTHKLSEELLMAREWDSFNRFASFILHDLKNLATLQGMTLDNAKHFGHKQEFIADAFATFHQTTEKMITLIASLSVQRGQFSLKQQPVNILEIIAQTFDHLKLDQRNGLRVRTAFPPAGELPKVSGDPELLQKAFTNLLLNAVQSLPKGEGAVEVTVARAPRGRIMASIRDTGCGIAPERLENLFRPFQTTKEKGLGIGLCHTRSIIEVHGGQIRIESQLNAGTKVEVELPAL